MTLGTVYTGKETAGLLLKGKVQELSMCLTMAQKVMGKVMTQRSVCISIV